jgi:hypothetical protein
MNLDGLRIQPQTLLLIDEELLHILALVALQLITSPISEPLTIVQLQANFFLMGLRIFFGPNFVGTPWMVVNVLLRPLRC